MKTRKNYLKGEKGFTLVEIIAVLITLGILSAVAAPRYMDLTKDAKNKACQIAIAEGKARINQAAAIHLLSQKSIPAASDFVVSDFGTSAGDFTIAYDLTGTTSVGLTAMGIVGSPAEGGTATGIATLPLS